MNPNTLKQARQTLGLTAAQLASVLGVSERVVHQWEEGTRNPRAIYRNAIADYLAGRRPPGWPTEPARKPGRPKKSVE